MKPSSVLPVRDFGSLGTVLWTLVALGLGIAAASFVHWDGEFGLRKQIDLLGPNPILVNDLPFLFTMAGMTLVGILIIFFSWVVKIGSFDRPLLALMAFSFNADVIPGLYQLSFFSFVIILISRGMKQGDIPIHFTPLILPILLVTVSYCTSFLDTVTPFGETIGMTYRVSYMLLIPLLPCVLRTRRQFEMFVHYLIIAAMIAVGVQLVELVLSGISNTPVTFGAVESSRASTPYGVFPRLTGLMNHPNHQSNLLSSEAVLALWVATRPRHLLSAGRRVFFATAYVFLALGVFLTWSRSGWLCLGITSLLIPVVRWPRFSPFYLGAMAVVGGLAYTSGIAQQAYEFVRDINASSADFRWHIDDIATQAWLWKPWTGIGVGNSVEYFNPYQLQVHDTYLEALSENGLFGFTVLGVLALMVFGRLFSVILKSTQEMDREWAWGLLFAATVTLIQNSFAMFLWIRFLWGLIAMMECVYLISRHQRTTAEPDDLLVLRPVNPRGSLPASSPA